MSELFDSGRKRSSSITAENVVLPMPFTRDPHPYFSGTNGEDKIVISYKLFNNQKAISTDHGSTEVPMRAIRIYFGLRISRWARAGPPVYYCLWLLHLPGTIWLNLTHTSSCPFNYDVIFHLE